MSFVCVCVKFQDECDAIGTEWVWNWSSRPEAVPQRSVFFAVRSRNCSHRHHHGGCSRSSSSTVVVAGATTTTIFIITNIVIIL